MTAPKSQEDKDLDLKAKTAAAKTEANVKRKAVLVKREKNRNGDSPYRLSEKQQKVEDKLNGQLQDLNTVITGQAPDVLA